MRRAAKLKHHLPVRALGCVKDHTALLSEGQWQSAKHLKALWWLFVALSWANESSLEIYVSKVIFLVTQRPAGPSVSTAPVQPSNCFMLDPNRLINHSSGHYGYSFTQTLHKINGTCSISESLLNCIIKEIAGSVSAMFSFFTLLSSIYAGKLL